MRPRRVNLGEAFFVERIERHVEPLHPGPREAFGMSPQLAAIGGERHFLEPVPDMSADRFDQLHDIAPHQRFPAGQPDLPDATLNERGDDLSISSKLSTSALGRKVMCSLMQ